MLNNRQLNKLIDKIIINIDKSELTLAKALELCKEEQNIDIKLFIKLSKLESKLHSCQNVMNQLRDLSIAKVKII